MNKPKRPLTVEDIEYRGRHFAKRYADGLSMRQISAETGWSVQTVYRHLQKANTKMRHKGNRQFGSMTFEERIRYCVDRYKEGATLAVIADEVGCSHTAVLAYLIKEGIPRRHRGGGLKGPRDHSRLADVRAMRASGFTFRVIGDRYGLMRQAIQLFLKTHKDAP